MIRLEQLEPIDFEKLTGIKLDTLMTVSDFISKNSVLKGFETVEGSDSGTSSKLSGGTVVFTDGTKITIPTGDAALDVNYIQSTVTPNAGNTGDGTLNVNEDDFTGSVDDVYYVKITTANTTAGSVDGAYFSWKKGSTGAYSPPVAVTSTDVTLEKDLKVNFALAAGQNLQAGDEFSVGFLKNFDVYDVIDKTGKISQVYVTPIGGPEPTVTDNEKLLRKTTIKDGVIQSHEDVRGGLSLAGNEIGTGTSSDVIDGGTFSAVPSNIIDGGKFVL